MSGPPPCSATRFAYHYLDLLETYLPRSQFLRSEYDPEFLWILSHAARIYGSDRKLEAEITYDNTAYAAMVNGFESLTGREVPTSPPTLDQIVSVRERLANVPEAIEAILARLTEVEMRHARYWDLFDPLDAVNFIDVDPRHAIFGDGCIFGRYSDVHEIAHPVTGETRIVGTRAQHPDRARMQAAQRRPGADGKATPGINFMTVYGWVPYGALVLAAGYTLGAEAPVLMPMLRLVLTAAGGGVFVLFYDGVVVGWLQEELMGNFGVEVMNKPARRQRGTGEVRAEDIVLHHALKDLNWVPTGEQRVLLFNETAAALLDSGYHLPVGVTIARRSDGFDVIDSIYNYFDLVHPGARPAHQDRLVLDNETLYLLDDDGRKGALCTPIFATRELTEQDTYVRRTRVLIPCPAGSWVYDACWRPRPTVSTRQRSELSPKEYLAMHLKPSSRALDSFRAFYRRETAESRNRSEKLAFPVYGRGAHLDVGLQILDHFSFAQVTNSELWQHHQLARKPFA